MPVSTQADDCFTAMSSDGARKETPVDRYMQRLFELFGPPVPWNRTTYIGLLTLVLLWAVRMYMTWATWGDLTIDCGHEMYVPAVLAEGKKLYRDVLYMYTPAAPYFNSYLFRMFGVHLNVLYWAGSISALASALLLYLCGMRLSSWVAGWTAGAILLIQAFERGIFSFPLPYTFSSVYGCLAACLFLWFCIRATASPTWIWMFGAATAAATALVLKPEFGSACYLTLLLLMTARAVEERSWRIVLSDMAAIVPGLIGCAWVIYWMISIAGADFITQENIMSWPTSYFMKTYGRHWLSQTGFSLTASTLRTATIDTLVFGVIGLLLYRLTSRWRSDARWMFIRLALYICAFALLVKWLPWQPTAALHYILPAEVLRYIFLPRDMVLYIALAAVMVWWYLFRQAQSKNVTAFALMLSFSGLLAFRILFRMDVTGYAIYYNAPVVLSFLFLMRAAIPHSGRSRRFVFQGELLLCFTCLVTVLLLSGRFPAPADLVPLTSARGTIRVSKQKAEAYQSAIAFMKQKASLGEAVLSIPEDTSLYFFSETHCPTRVFSFIPGVLSPGKMTEDVMREIAQTPVQYLLWSNRTFEEYGVPVFGIHFDRTLGDYFKSHYRFVRPLVAGGGGWNAGIWERRP